MVQLTLLVAFLFLTLRKLKWSLFLVRELYYGLFLKKYLFLCIGVHKRDLSLVLANLFLDQLVVSDIFSGMFCLYNAHF